MQRRRPGFYYLPQGLLLHAFIRIRAAKSIFLSEKCVGRFLEIQLDEISPLNRQLGFVFHLNKRNSAAHSNKQDQAVAIVTAESSFLILFDLVEGFFKEENKAVSAQPEIG